MTPEYQQNREAYTVQSLDSDDMIPKYSLAINRFQPVTVQFFLIQHLSPFSLCQ